MIVSATDIATSATRRKSASAVVRRRERPSTHGRCAVVSQINGGKDFTF